MKHIAPQGVARKRFDERREKRRGFANPIGEGRAGEIDALARVDLRLAIERQVIAVFEDEDVGEKSRPGLPTQNRQRGHRRLHDPLARPARQLRPHVADHFEARWLILQHLSHVFAQGGHRAAASRADWGRLVEMRLARQMLRQRLADGLIRLGFLARCHRRDKRSVRFQILERQLQLFDGAL